MSDDEQKGTLRFFVRPPIHSPEPGRRTDDAVVIIMQLMSPQRAREYNGGATPLIPEVTRRKERPRDTITSVRVSYAYARRDAHKLRREACLIFNRDLI